MPKVVKNCGKRRRLHIKGDELDEFDMRNIDKFREIMDSIHPLDGCKIWPLSCNPTGSPVFCLIGGKRIGADRFSATISIGQPVLTQIVIHTCGNIRCVSENHLRWGTRSERQQIMVAQGRLYIPPSKGEQNPAHLLRDDDVAFIRSSALSQQKLAKLFNVSVSTISMCQLGRTWRHLPGARDYSFQPVPYERPRQKRWTA